MNENMNNEWKKIFAYQHVQNEMWSIFWNLSDVIKKMRDKQNKLKDKTKKGGNNEHKILNMLYMNEYNGNIMWIKCEYE